MNETTWTKYEGIEDLPSKLFVENPDEGEDLPVFDLNILNEYYYLDGDDDDNPVEKKNRACRAIEDEIDRLEKEKEQWTRRDVYRILAWKIGKIRHFECQKENVNYMDGVGSSPKFIYHKNCSESVGNDEAKIQLPNGNEIKGEEFNKFADIVIALRSAYINQTKSAEAIWDDLVKESLDGIGTVYLITLLHFITNGKKPIFDRFAMASIVVKHLETLRNNKNEEIKIKRGAVIHISGLPDKKQKSTFELLNATSIYEQYTELLKRYFPNDWQKREVDRALWVYGHYFKVTY